MSVGQDEPVAVRPVGLGRVVAHHLGEEHVGQGGQGHRRSGVTGVGGPGCVHGQAPDDIDSELVEIAVTGRIDELGGALSH